MLYRRRATPQQTDHTIPHELTYFNRRLILTAGQIDASVPGIIYQGLIHGLGRGAVI